MAVISMLTSAAEAAVLSLASFKNRHLCLFLQPLICGRNIPLPRPQIEGLQSCEMTKRFDLKMETFAPSSLLLDGNKSHLSRGGEAARAAKVLIDPAARR